MSSSPALLSAFLSLSASSNSSNLCLLCILTTPFVSVVFRDVSLLKENSPSEGSCGTLNVSFFHHTLPVTCHRVGCSSHIGTALSWVFCKIPSAISILNARRRSHLKHRRWQTNSRCLAFYSCCLLIICVKRIVLWEIIVLFSSLAPNDSDSRATVRPVCTDIVYVNTLCVCIDLLTCSLVLFRL